MIELRRVLRGSATSQDRFERSVAGEVTVSVLVVLILACAVIWSAPESALRRASVPVVEPLALTGGLDQAWYMFAPDPFRRLESVEVVVDTARGEQLVWTFPTGGVLDQFSWYRWHKLKETAVRTPEIRGPIARWAARGLLAPPDYPALVSMVLVVEGFTPPDVDDAPPDEVSEVLYTETLTGPP